MEIFAGSKSSNWASSMSERMDSLSESTSTSRVGSPMGAEGGSASWRSGSLGSVGSLRASGSGERGGEDISDMLRVVMIWFEVVVRFSA